MGDWVVVHKDGKQLLALDSQGWWFWTEPESESVRRYKREDAEAVQLLAPWRVRKNVGGIRKMGTAPEADTSIHYNGE